eukprot:12116842-Prorocentrum_lima.AAC.1
MVEEADDFGNAVENANIDFDEIPTTIVGFVIIDDRVSTPIIGNDKWVRWLRKITKFGMYEHVSYKP